MSLNKHRKFTRRVENFTCIKCGFFVEGDGFTNHCPYCLWSVHVDINPGDRASNCRGIMKPIRTEYLNNEFSIIHKCLKCGIEKKNRSSNLDNRDLLIKLIPKLK